MTDLLTFVLVARLGSEVEFKTPHRASRSSVSETSRDAVESASVQSVDPSSILSRWEEDNLLSESFIFWFQILNSLVFLLETDLDDDDDENDSISYEDLDSHESLGISRLTTN